MHAARQPSPFEVVSATPILKRERGLIDPFRCGVDSGLESAKPGRGLLNFIKGHPLILKSTENQCERSRNRLMIFQGFH